MVIKDTSGVMFSKKNNWSLADASDTIEFFLNEFPWIHCIQWIMQKHKIGMVSRNTPHLVIAIFSNEVVKMKYRYLPRGSKENVLSITITGKVTMPG